MLDPGTRLGPYEVLAPIGSGGMGEVYRARDTRLDRDVAVKVLPPAMSADPDRLRRFEREARAAGALNHPNLMTVFDVGDAESGPYIVLELLEGTSLRARLDGQGLPLATALDYSAQIAHGLAAAHDKGIVHRDLKPANLFVTRDGRVKILDFGLAKLVEARPGAADVSQTDTAPTELGTVLGTVGYMSPEQVQGLPADHRSDIFSLGAVMYEMLTGRRAFAGSTVEALHAILKDDPQDPSTLAPVGPALTAIVRRCLAKNPEDRFQSARDLAFALQTADSQSGASPGAFQRWRPRRAAVAVTAIAAAALAAYAIYSRARPPARVAAAPLRAAFSQLTSQPGVEWFPSLSPDGKWVVYSGTGSGSRHVYLQSVSGQNTLDLSGDSTADDDQPAFSPDGERIAFRSSREGGGIFVMGRTGEAIRRVTRVGFKPSWSPDGTQLAFTTENVDLNPQNSQGQGPSQLWTVDVNAGATRRLNEGDAILASWSPHNHRIAFSRRLGSQGQRGSIWTIPAAGGTPTQVTSGRERDWNPVWAPDGSHLYFASDRGGSMNLWRIPIDEASGQAQGEAEPITTPAPFLAHASLSGDGKRIAYASVLVTANIQRLTLDPASGAVKGEPAWVTTGSRRWANPDPSPDGNWVVFYSLTQPEGDLYVARPDGTGLRQLTSDAAVDRVPRWSPDGQWIACFSTRSGRLELWKIRPDGSDLQQLTEGGGSYVEWSPDGSRLAALGAIEEPAVKGRVFIFDPNRPWREQTPQVLPPLDAQSFTRFFVNSWSPDGERLVGGIGQVDVMSPGIAAYSLRARSYEQLTDSGQWPVWLPDSRRVMFVSGGNAFFMVDTRTKQVRKIFSVSRDVIGPPRLTRDGKAAYFSRRVTESDVWLLTLQ